MSDQGPPGAGGADISDFIDATVGADDDATLPLLRHGEVTVIGRMPYSSNATFLVDVRHEGERAQGIYKPERGERPLHDFGPGLWRREVAAAVLSDLAGWGLVPPTVGRDGPLGTGSVQLFRPSDYAQHYFTLKDDPRHREVLRRLCAFDVVINNTDRKSGHVLAGVDGRLWAIDNGLSFHAVGKLRTVIWDHAGTSLGAELAGAVAEIGAADLDEALADLIEPDEIEATARRARSLASGGVFPVDVTGRAYPWPLV